MYSSGIDEVGLEDLIDKYLKNTLSEEDLAEFEILILEDKYLFENVQLTRALQQAVKAEQQSLLKAIKPEAKLNAWLKQPLSMAATILIACSLLFNFYPAVNSIKNNTQESFFVDSYIILDRTRGQTSLFNVPKPGPHLIQIDVGVMPVSALFEVKLLEPGNDEVIYFENELTADDGGWLRLLLNENVSGEYSLELSWLEKEQVRRSTIYKINFEAPI